MSTSDARRQQYPGGPVDILLVEDNPGDVRLTREAFEETDRETILHVVTTGDDAVDFLTREGEYESASLPDLVLLDLNLPGRDGDEILETVRDDPRLQCLPVIILTSSESSEDIVRCYEADANAYLTKPTNFDEFVSMIETVERFWFSFAKLPPM